MLVTPDLYPEFSKISLCSLRSIVETALGIVGYFKMSSNKFRGPPTEQIMCITICYELCQWKMMKSLLRPNYFPPHLRQAIYSLADNVLHVTPNEVQAIWTAAWEKDVCVEQISAPVCDPRPQRMMRVM